MKPWTALIFAGGLAMTPGLAGAQATSDNRVAAETDWSVFVEEDPRECWVVSSPKEIVNTRDGRPVAVRRGDVLLFVTYRPQSGVAGEVSFTGGYPFNEGSTVRMEVGDSSFELLTDGEWAWPASPEEDARVVEAMKAGTQVVLTGMSSRGTTTKDIFSLIGISAALDEAGSRCTN